MTKQSVNFTSPNDDWLNAKVESKEYPNKTDIVNDLIRREREREEKFQTLKAAIEEGFRRHQQLIHAGCMRGEKTAVAVVGEDEIGDGADQR